MSVLDLFLPSRAVTDFALSPAAAVARASGAGQHPVSRINAHIDQVQTDRINAVNQSAGMCIPAVRRAVHVIAGTIATFGLSAWQNGVRLPKPAEPTWLHQPDYRRTLYQTLYGTMTDAIWRDWSVWRVVDRYVGSNLPAALAHIDGARVSHVASAHDPLQWDTVTIDGGAVNLDDLVVFHWAGTGGLRRFGWDLLDLYAALQAAAANYAKAPHPKAILKNHGGDLLDDEIDTLLADWEAHRATRSVGYLNDVVDYDVYGWNAAELQLTEAREHAALEVARLFGLPARALDAPTSGSSMTYANVTESRVDLLEALHPWFAPIEQTLSMDWGPTRAGRVTAHGITVQMDVDAFVRDQPAVRMATWASALASGVLTVDEVRRWEPLASETGETP